MKAISIRQPWAWAILTAGKRVENRSWSTTYRGPLLIHAAKGLTRTEYDQFVMFWERDISRRPLQTYAKCQAFESLDRGGIVGKTNLIDVIHSEETVSRDRTYGFAAHQSPWFFGPYGFVFSDVQSIPFVPLRGALGLFDVDEALLKGHA